MGNMSVGTFKAIPSVGHAAIHASQKATAAARPATAQPAGKADTVQLTACKRPERALRNLEIAKHVGTSMVIGGVVTGFVAGRVGASYINGSAGFARSVAAFKIGGAAVIAGGALAIGSFFYAQHLRNK